MLCKQGYTDKGSNNSGLHVLTLLYISCNISNTNSHFYWELYGTYNIYHLSWLLLFQYTCFFVSKPALQNVHIPFTVGLGTYICVESYTLFLVICYI